MSNPVQKAAIMNAKMASWKRVGLALVAFSTVSVAGIGFLHTSAGRPLLMKLGGCPVGNVDPHAVQVGAQAAVAKQSGDELAPSRPALGFALDRTKLADVEAWADKHDLACETAREDTLYKCKLVPVDALPEAGGMAGRVDDLTFAFRDDGTLWTLSAWSFKLPADEATARLHGVTRAMEHAAIAPATTYGAIDEVGSAPGTGSGAKYKYKDYVANLTATTAPDGVMVQQQYSSVRASGPAATAN